MIRDEITEEIRAIRHQLAAQFGNDISRIGADLRQRQQTSGRKIVEVPKRIVHASQESLTASTPAISR